MTSSTAHLTEVAVSQYLRDNPDFLRSFLAQQHNVKDSISGRSTEEDTCSENDAALSGPKHKAAKVSFPGLSTLPAARNSITVNMFKSYLKGERARKTSNRDRASMGHMSEQEMFMELIKDIASELDVSLLCHKILRNVSILTGSDRGSLFLVRGNREQRWLVSKLFDVTENSTLEDCAHNEENEIRVPFGKGIAGMVAQNNETINISDAYQDPRFNQEVDKLTGYTTHSILCMPITNYEGDVIGVAQIINKTFGKQEFSKQDEEVFRKYLTFCGIGITNAQLFEMSVNEYKRNQLLLNLARGIFEEQTNLNSLVQKIMIDAQELLKCEKCSVYLLEGSIENDVHKFTRMITDRLGGKYPHKGLVMAMQDPGNPNGVSHSTALETRGPKSIQDVHFSMVFDLYAKDDGNIVEPSPLLLAKSKNAEVAKYVVLTQTALNVADIETDGRFGHGPFVDDRGFKTRAVLCTPIYNNEKRIIGITQLVNKVNGQPFNENDENIIEAFSIFTGLGIHNCQMYENACRLMAKQSVALEVLSYHATATKEEAEKLLHEDIPTADGFTLYSYEFDDSFLSDHDTLKATVRMYIEADIINTFKIPYEVLCRWACSVKKNYRPVTYHNWRHAFNVCQTMFTMMYVGDMARLFSKLEIFALMTACLCHDLDHRGTNNAFQVKVFSPLAMLYSTSVLEHHHFDHCIMILNSEGNNIFQSLSAEDYRRVIKILEHAILSTDLAVYFKKRGDFKQVVASGETRWEDSYKRDLLKAMMMTACDVAAICKPWKIQQSVAQLVANEFFGQGDIEREQLGENPIPMMDRAKKDELPKMQVGFIDAICMPVYELFAQISPTLAPLYAGCQNNRKHWHQLADEYEKRLQHGAKDIKPSVSPVKTESRRPSQDTSRAQNTNQNGNLPQSEQLTKGIKNSKICQFLWLPCCSSNDNNSRVGDLENTSPTPPEANKQHISIISNKQTVSLSETSPPSKTLRSAKPTTKQKSGLCVLS